MAGAYSRLSEVIAGYGGFDDIDEEFRQLPHLSWIEMIERLRGVRP